jgi:hypothetical protein
LDAIFQSLPEAKGPIPQGIEWNAQLLRHRPAVADPGLFVTFVVAQDKRARVRGQAKQAIPQDRSERHFLGVNVRGRGAFHFLYSGFVPDPLLGNLVRNHARDTENIPFHVNDRLVRHQFPGNAVQRFVGVFLGKYGSFPTEELHESPAYSLIPLASLGTLRMELIQKLVKSVFS